VNDRALRQRLSQQAVERAKTFEWSQKASEMVAIYHHLLSDPNQNQSHLQTAIAN
jgi:hypothetical protein